MNRKEEKARKTKAEKDYDHNNSILLGYIRSAIKKSGRNPTKVFMAAAEGLLKKSNRMYLDMQLPTYLPKRFNILEYKRTTIVLKYKESLTFAKNYFHQLVEKGVMNEPEYDRFFNRNFSTQYIDVELDFEKCPFKAVKDRISISYLFYYFMETEKEGRLTSFGPALRRQFVALLIDNFVCFNKVRAEKNATQEKIANAIYSSTDKRFADWPERGNIFGRMKKIDKT